MANNLSRFSHFNDIARFDPFRGFESLLNEFRPALRGAENDSRVAIEVTENDQAYSVKADMPGVKKEDIKVDINGSQVSISAETRRENEQKDGESIVRSERFYGQLFRSFTLASDIDEEKAEARYQDGVLELKLPKKSGGGGRKLVVN